MLLLKLLANMENRDNTFAMCMFDISQLIAVAKPGTLLTAWKRNVRKYLGMRYLQPVERGNKVCPFKARFSIPLFCHRQRKVTIAKLYFRTSSPLKKLVLALQSLIISCFYLFYS